MSLRRRRALCRLIAGRLFEKKSTLHSSRLWSTLPDALTRRRFGTQQPGAQEKSSVAFSLPLYLGDRRGQKTLMQAAGALPCSGGRQWLMPIDGIPRSRKTTCQTRHTLCSDGALLYADSRGFQTVLEACEARGQCGETQATRGEATVSPRVCLSSGAPVCVNRRSPMVHFRSQQRVLGHQPNVTPHEPALALSPIEDEVLPILDHLGHAFIWRGPPVVLTSSFFAAAVTTVASAADYTSTIALLRFFAAMNRFPSIADAVNL